VGYQGAFDLALTNTDIEVTKRYRMSLD
jgi:hypothetical protein